MIFKAVKYSEHNSVLNALLSELNDIVNTPSSASRPANVTMLHSSYNHQLGLY